MELTDDFTDANEPTKWETQMRGNDSIQAVGAAMAHRPMAVRSKEIWQVRLTLAGVRGGRDEQ